MNDFVISEASALKNVRELFSKLDYISRILLIIILQSNVKNNLAITFMDMG